MPRCRVTVFSEKRWQSPFGLSFFLPLSLDNTTSHIAVPFGRASTEIKCQHESEAIGGAADGRTYIVTARPLHLNVQERCTCRRSVGFEFPGPYVLCCQCIRGSYAGTAYQQMPISSTTQRAYNAGSELHDADCVRIQTNVDRTTARERSRGVTAI
ncbi:hypothetical protein EDD15DRAFT_934639 [Pisolithus albus]|nr:hypothetical protein EDD15DRAFT_934639 [Pisolithus albus]